LLKELELELAIHEHSIVTGIMQSRSSPSLSDSNSKDHAMISLNHVLAGDLGLLAMLPGQGVQRFIGCPKAAPLSSTVNRHWPMLIIGLAS
jgi:hypothetical protein